MTARRTTTILASAAVLAGALALAPTTAGGQTATCEQPYAPVAFADLYPAQEELPTVDAERLLTERLGSPLAFDSDGDGTDDTVTREADGVTITRGDGDVVLTAGGDPANATGVGDIDGDGRDELQVQTGDSVFLVPGTVPTGTTPVADAGIRMPFGTVGLIYLNDGTDRLLVYRPATNSLPETITDIHDAGEVLAVGPGGDAGPLTPSLSVPGTIQFAVDTNGPLLLVSGRSVSGGSEDNRVELFLVDGDVITELTTLPEPYRAEYVAPFGTVTILDGPDGTFVELVQSSRSGSGAYLWSLDDPCTALVDDTTPPPTTTPTAPPAAPVDAEAAFTG